GGGQGGLACDPPARGPSDPPTADGGGAALRRAPAEGQAPRLRRYRLRRLVSDTSTGVLAVALLIWWLLPVYNMLLIALDPEGKTEFTGDIWPAAPTLEAFRGVLFQRYCYLQHSWHQLR